MNFPIEQIVVGKRVRQDYGDIHSLAHSIAQPHGLIHPLLVRPHPDDDALVILVAGARRLEAVKILGWSSVPCTVAHTLDDGLDALRAEIEENTQRKALSSLEAIEQGRELEPLARREAKERMIAAHASPDKLSELGNALDKVAHSVGMSRSTYVHAKAIVEAAEEDPERFDVLRERLDRGEAIDSVWQDLERARLSETEAPAPEYKPNAPVGIPDNRALFVANMARVAGTIYDALVDDDPPKGVTVGVAVNGKEFWVKLEVAS